MKNAQTLKGFRDFLPKEARKRQYAMKILQEVFELYGFEPLETPALEYQELLLGKYGDEADKLVYKFEDRGGRSVAMRYDQTVPLARVAITYPELPMPFKRYQMQNVWRAENTQKGRYREFLQCDIDTLGDNNINADIEILNCISDAMKRLGFTDAKLLINSRKVFNNLDTKYIISIDKLDKIGEEGVVSELISKGMNSEDAKNIIIKLKNTKAVSPVTEIIKRVKNTEFSPTLARGLDYYTDMVCELVVPTYTGGSLGGGGRYDKLIGQLTDKDMPAVGFAFGFDRLIEAMDELGLFPSEAITTSTKILVTVFNKDLFNKSSEILNKLRENNINSEILSGDIKLDKQLKYANKKQIPYVIILGSDEIKNNKLILKNMNTGKQDNITTDELINKLRE